jgi:hypothetical protein
MKTTIVLAVLLAATPAFADSPGATLQDYRAAPHQQRATKKPAKPLHMQAAPTQKEKQAAPTQKPAK